MIASNPSGPAQSDSGAGPRFALVLVLLVGCPDPAPLPGVRSDAAIPDGGTVVVDTGPRVVPAPTELIRFNLLDTDLSTALVWTYDGTTLPSGLVSVGDSSFGSVAAGSHTIATSPIAASMSFDLPPRGDAVVAAIGAPDSIELAAFTVDESSVASDGAYLLHASDSLGVLDARLVPESGAPLVLATGLMPRGESHVLGVAEGEYTVEVDTDRNGAPDLYYPLTIGDWATYLVLGDMRGTTVMGVRSQRDLGMYFPRRATEPRRLGVVNLVHDVSAIDVRSGETELAREIPFGGLTVHDVGTVTIHATDDGALLATGAARFGFWRTSVVIAYGSRDESFTRAFSWFPYPRVPLDPRQISVRQLAPSLGTIDVITPAGTFAADHSASAPRVEVGGGEIVGADVDRDGTVERMWMMPELEPGLLYVAALALDRSGELSFWLFDPGTGTLRLVAPMP